MPININFPISVDLLNNIIPSPNTSRNATLQPIIEKLCNLYGINTNLRLAAFIANIGSETNSFNLPGFIESESYRLEVLKKKLGEDGYVSGISSNTNNLTDAQLQVLMSDKRRILDWCYTRPYKNTGKNILGNQVVSADYVFNTPLNGTYITRDGYNFRGRGLMQMTGREAYETFEREVNTSIYRQEITNTSSQFEIVNNPDLISSNDSLAVWSASWEFSKKRGVLSNADAKNIKKVRYLINGGVNALPDVIRRYNFALRALGEAPYSNDFPINSTSKNFASNPNDESTETLTVNFENLEANIRNAESSDINVSWGNRSSSKEESDFIGLKQFILYLMSKFYPQRLVPFVELIPFFTVQDIYSQQEVFQNVTKKLTNTGEVITETSESSKPLKTSTLINDIRYNLTAAKLATFRDQEGVDLLTIDPFEEFTNSFNKINDAGEAIFKERNLSYKVYGSLVINPSETEFATSKPGAIGLENVEVQIGAPEHHGMSLINISLKDVQGNKLLDPNSPWSFILNTGARQQTSDFFFRFGWQFELPVYNENEIWENDINARSFWKHEGWNIFTSLVGEKFDKSDASKTIKKYISSLASEAANTLTFTQNIDEFTLKNPGFELNNSEGTLRRKRDLNNNNYYTLTLINADLSTNSSDGSITAMLSFRTKAAVANCMCPIYLAENTKTLVKKDSCTLSELMTAFINDNKNHLIRENSIIEKQDNKFSSSYNVKDISNWLTVIGGVYENDFLEINPEDITIPLDPNLKFEILNPEVKNTDLLLSWVNSVLSQNEMSLLASGAFGQNASNKRDVNSGFVIVCSKKNLTSSNRLQDKDISFGEFLQYSEIDKTNRFFVGNRLLAQDDVLGFRFQGSLIEEISVDKVSNETKQTLDAKNKIAQQINSSNPAAISPSDVSTKTENSNTEIVSVNTKETNIAIIYSQMSVLHATMICHPWLKLGRAIFVKGMGFWDGKYIVTKLTHKLDVEGKFTTNLSASRVISGQSNKINENNNRNYLSRSEAQRSMITKDLNQLGRGDIFNLPGVQKPPVEFQTFNDVSAATSVTVTNPINLNLPKELTGNSQQEPFLSLLNDSVETNIRAFIKEVEKQAGEQVFIIETYLSWDFLIKESLDKTLNNLSIEGSKTVKIFNSKYAKYKGDTFQLLDSYYFWGMGITIRGLSTSSKNTIVSNLVSKYKLKGSYDILNNVHHLYQPIVKTDILRRKAIKQFQTNKPELYPGNLISLKN